MMPRTKLTTPETDAEFRAAVGKVVKDNIPGSPSYTEKLTDQAAAQMAAGNAMGAQERLRALVQRIEGLEDEKNEAAEAIKEVYAEARGEGFAVKVLRLVVRRRRRRRQEVQEEDELVSLYEGQLEGEQ